MANPFQVEVPSLYEALIAGERGYKGMRDTQSQNAMSQARQEAQGALMGGGDTRSALARLIGAGDMQGATAISNMTNAEADREWRRQEAARAQTNADRSFGLQQRQLSATLGNQTFSRDLQTQELALKREALNKKDVPNTEAEVIARRQAVVSQGHDPNDPQFRAFILSGKMPREDQQPLTATDKKAILEADESVLSARTAIEALNKAKEISPKAYGFRGAGALSSVGSLLPGEGASEATLELDNIVTSNALTQLKAIFGGAPTEGERKILLDIQGASSLPDKVRQKIFDRAIALAQHRLKFNEQRANEMRGGSYYKAGGSAQPGQAAAQPAPVAPAAPSGVPAPPAGFQLVQ
jgi:hypothetical protein